MIDNSNASAGGSLSAPGADAVAGNGIPSRSSVPGDASLVERQAAGQALVDAGLMTAAQVADFLRDPTPAGGSPGTASAQHLAETQTFVSGLSEADAKAWVKGDIQAGLISWQQGAELLAGRGKTVAAPAQTVEEMKVAAKAADIDEAWPAGAPEDFKLPALTADDGGELDAGAFVATAKTVQTVLAAGEFPAEIGSFIAKEVASTQTMLAKMAKESKAPGADRALWIQEQRVQLESRYGDQLDAKLGLANRFLDELGRKHPAMVDWLHDQGATSNAAIITQVVEHASRLAQKRGVDVSQFGGKRV